MNALPRLSGLRRCLLWVRQADQVGHSDHARDPSRVGLGAGLLIGPVDHSGNCHPAILNVNIQPVSRNRQIPINRVQNQNTHVFPLGSRHCLPRPMNLEIGSRPVL
jgi:hypothetical protein